MQAISPVTTPASLQKGVARSTAQQAEAGAASLAGASAAPLANPALRFDLKLGLVVVEFFDDAGELANSVPSPRQLKAYEAGLNVRSGPVPMSRDLPAGANQDGLAVVA